MPGIDSPLMKAFQNVFHDKINQDEEDMRRIERVKIILNTTINQMHKREFYKARQNKTILA